MDKDKIDKCLGCNKAIIQTEGKRERKWCSDACRMATARRSIPNKPIANTNEQPIPNKPKRGKDIKCFADLPPDVQRNINEISESNEEKQRRTAIAIGYQHIFPDSYDKHLSFEQNESGGYIGMKVTGKPGDADYDGICTPEWRAARGR